MPDPSTEQSQKAFYRTGVNKPGYKAFISYSRKDKPVIMRYVDLLRHYGVDVWIDESGINASSDWAEQIVHGITHCDIFIVFLSGSSINSENVRKEIGLAASMHKKILPFKIQDVEIPPALLYHLNSLHFIEAGKITNEQVIEHVFNATGRTVPKPGMANLDKPGFDKPSAQADPPQPNKHYSDKPSPSPETAEPETPRPKKARPNKSHSAPDPDIVPLKGAGSEKSTATAKKSRAPLIIGLFLLIAVFGGFTLFTKTDKKDEEVETQPIAKPGSEVEVSAITWLNPDEYDSLKIKFKLTNKHAYTISEPEILFHFYDVTGEKLDETSQKTISGTIGAGGIKKIDLLDLGAYPNDTIKVVGEVLSAAKADYKAD